VEKEELQALVDAGLSVRAIAEELGVSSGSVRHWLERHGLATRRTRLRQARRREDGHRPKSVESVCPTHGATTYLLEGRGSYRCSKCRVESVTRRRRSVRAVLVEEAGGRCRLCGYDRYIGSLHFHHVVPSEKAFAVSERGLTRSLVRAREEARKCILLCSNCHAEAEAGLHAPERLSELRGWDSNPQPLG
jgi:5-methylcytosine-specific restriction endonuclease McrA